MEHAKRSTIGHYFGNKKGNESILVIGDIHIAIKIHT